MAQVFEFINKTADKRMLAYTRSHGLKATAAITSVMPLPKPAAELAAAQQSRSMKASDLACSSIVWRPNHWTTGDFGLSVLKQSIIILFRGY